MSATMQHAHDLVSDPTVLWSGWIRRCRPLALACALPGLGFRLRRRIRRRRVSGGSSPSHTTPSLPPGWLPVARCIRSRWAGRWRPRPPLPYLGRGRASCGDLVGRATMVSGLHCDRCITYSPLCCSRWTGKCLKKTLLGDRYPLMSEEG